MLGRSVNPRLNGRPLRGLASTLAVVAALVLGFLPSPTARAHQSPRPGATPPLEVLFVGNSFTFFNNLPDVVAGISRALTSGPEIRPTMLASGGMTLQWHLATGRAATAIESRPWTAVVLQEQSALGAGTEDGNIALSPPGIFHDSVRRFVPLIRARGATPILLMTWARRARPGDQALLTTAYQTIGTDLNVEVSPVGVAWQQARQRWPTLDLFVEDGSHPNPTGSYLAACVLYASLTGRSPVGAPAVIEGHPYSRALQNVDLSETVMLVRLSPSLARRLQSLAWSVAVQRGRGKG